MDNLINAFSEIVTDLADEEDKHPVVPYISSNELHHRLDLSLNQAPLEEKEFKQALKNLVFSTPRTASKAFFNQLFGGRNEKAVLGDLLAVVLNNSMYTYKVAGAQVGVEKTILREVCNLLGWDERSGGTFAPGGSMTNMMAMLMARDQFNERIRQEGVRQPMTVYTSEEGHYSIHKNASFCGLGTNHIRKIATDDHGRMIVDELQKQIDLDLSEGFDPILVNATAGTTVLGAFDPVKAISAVCRKYNIWLHVDGAYCGSVLFSQKYNRLIEGIDSVDSFSFNAHKMLGTPLSCSLLVTKDKKHLNHSFSNDASYLYQTDHDENNLGKTSLQCGRRNDALKFWTLWKSVGTSGLEKIVDHQFELARVAREYVLSNSDYHLYSHDDSISICFNYKDIPARRLCTLLYEKSELMVGYGSKGGNEFVRLVTINAQNDEEDILNFFHLLEEFADINEEILLKKTQVS